MMNGPSARSVLTTFGIFASLACGGGGGGGGGGGPTTPAPPTMVAVQGSLEGFSDPGANFQGSQANLVGQGTVSIDSNNQFRFEDVPIGLHDLSITGAGHLARKVTLRVTDGGTNHFDGIDLVESSSGFNLAAFDEIYRESFDTLRTVRWLERPARVRLDRSSLASLPQGLSFFEREIGRAYSTWLPANTNGFFSGTPVDTADLGQVPDDIESACLDVPEGEIYIFGNQDCSMEDGFIILGVESHCWRTGEENNVAAAAVFFNPCTNAAVLMHELIHTLCADHLLSRPNASIMGSPGVPTGLKELDERHMQYLYSRPSGVATPDDSTGLTPLEPRIG